MWEAEEPSFMVLGSALVWGSVGKVNAWGDSMVGVD